MRSDHLSKHMKRHQNPSLLVQRSNIKNSNNYIIKKSKKKNDIAIVLEDPISEFGNIDNLFCDLSKKKL